MSLQVWLPLNGDLHNQGLQNITVTNNGATVNTNGKIGKCYNFNNSMGIVVNNSITLGTTFSITCWIKINSYNQDWANAFKIYKDSYDYIGLCMNQANATTKQLGFHIYKNNGSNARTGVTDGYYMPLTIGKWYHLCFIVTPTQVITYQDGIKIKINNITTNFPSITNYNLSLGKSSLFGGLDCSINDFRLYDHTLSDKEVEELSKGLVLHYTLNESNSNLLYTMPKSFNATAYNAYQFNMTENLVANQTYTLQLWDVDVYHSAKTAAQTGVWVYWGGGSVHLFNWAGPTYFTQEGTNNYHADYLVKTFTPTSTNASGNGATNAWFNIYNSVGYVEGTLNMHIGAWKLEKGSVATPWKDSADNNIVYDSSGYNNNGTITGTLVNSSLNTPRYNSSAIFNGTERITTNSLPTETKTLTCWAKTTKNKSTSQQIIADSNSALTISFYNGTIIGVFGTTRNTGSKCTLGTEYKENDWNFFAVVKTSEDGKRDIYCNGVKLTPTSNDYWSAATGFFVGARNTSQGNPFYGEINDIRAYVTALTSEQILELYNTSATIDNNGNMYSRELVET